MVFFFNFCFYFSGIACFGFFFFCKHQSFLLFNDYIGRKFFNSIYGGYFPFSFFNKIFFNGGFYKFSYVLKAYNFRYSHGKDRGYDLIFDADIHVSTFFGNWSFAFPRRNSFIYFFKYWAMHLYFVFREHDRSVYFKDYFNFLLDSHRLITDYYKSPFFINFYRGLKYSLFCRFFNSYILWDYSFYFIFVFFFAMVNSTLRFFFFFKIFFLFFGVYFYLRLPFFLRLKLLALDFVFLFIRSFYLGIFYSDFSIVKSFFFRIFFVIFQ